MLQEADLKLPEDSTATFDKNTIVDTASFVDIEFFDATRLQLFLHRTPYARPSFLETYQSNGVRASDALTRAARTYNINPLVFLIYAQSAQGLVGEQNYPFPPERVEYVFRCGCKQDDNCLPELAGFDRQVDCLGRTLRVALDQIIQKGTTTGGWGKDSPSFTLDSIQVSPTTEATAAVYDYIPRVDEESAGGSWLFWNVWNLYAGAAKYSGAAGGPGITGGWIGDGCTSKTACGFDEAICATKNYPGGMCTLACKGDCPTQENKPESFCADFSTSGFCLPICNPGASACRKGYACTRLKRFGATDTADSKYVCTVP